VDIGAGFPFADGEFNEYDELDEMGEAPTYA